MEVESYYSFEQKANKFYKTCKIIINIPIHYE